MPLSPRRLFLGTSTALVLAAFAASMMAARSSVAVSARHEAADRAARLGVSMNRDVDTRALSLSYLERARLGLGSPFRLVDLAAHDARLADSVRQDVAWAVIDRVFGGDVYEIDPRALDIISQPGTGEGHLALIQDVIGNADEPEVAAAAVRTAYALAASSGFTSLTSVPVVAEVVSQVRDRALAMRDLARAVPRAREDGVSLVEEVVRSRATRAFDVERPVMGSLSARDREAVIEMAPAILQRIERVSASGSEPARLSLVDKAAASDLARLAARRPPIAAIRVPVSGRAGTLRADSALPRSALAVIAAASNEESLVAAFAYADRASEGMSPSLRRLMVSAGVFLRAHAQDRVRSTEELASAGAVMGRFGLKAIAFDPEVPRAWRPYYTQMIADALDDFALALPAYDPAGLSFRVEMAALPDSALAMHDPRTHTIRLAAMTPSGTLAHELAHDVDWRAARRLFSKSGGYATDRSMRESTLRLSSTVRGLTAARIAGRGRISPHGSSRPAEVFARSVDWFVADALAAMGRSNGFLSAIEDPLLAGFAAMPSDAPSQSAARALVGTLTEMTYVPDSLSLGYLARWESLDAIDPATLVLRTLDAPVFTRRTPRLPLGVTPQAAAWLATGALCRVAGLREGSAQDRLLAMALDARARGIVARRARFTPASPRAGEDLALVTARVAEGMARAGLIDLAPAPFRPRCD